MLLGLMSPFPDLIPSIASLQLASLLNRTSLSNGVRQIISGFQLVRMQAIARNRRLRVTFQPGTNRYVVEKRENGRWLGHHLHSHGDGGNDGVCIRLPSTVVISAANSRGDVIFVPRGQVDGGMTLTLTSRDGGFSKRVVINLAGRVRID